MVTNINISQFRDEDLSSEKRRKRQKLLKRVTWCKNLVEVYKISNDIDEDEVSEE